MKQIDLQYVFAASCDILAEAHRLEDCGKKQKIQSARLGSQASKLQTQGTTYLNKGNDCYAKGIELTVFKLEELGRKLQTKGRQMKAEASRLYDQAGVVLHDGASNMEKSRLLKEIGVKMWDLAVVRVYGDVKVDWKTSTHCIVDGKDHYRV
jgi:hypothetical protein